MCCPCQSCLLATSNETTSGMVRGTADNNLLLLVAEDARRCRTLGESHFPQCGTVLVLPTFGCSSGTIHVAHKAATCSGRRSILGWKLDIARVVIIRYSCVKVRPAYVNEYNLHALIRLGVPCLRRFVLELCNSIAQNHTKGLERRRRRKHSIFSGHPDFAGD